MTFTGILVAIYTASGAGRPMIATASIEAREGVGLAGDRYAMRTGFYSDHPGKGREVTLIEREVIAAVNREGTVTIGEHETRRNLVTEGVPLNHLVGRTFRVGTVVLAGRRLAEPCAYLDSVTRPGVRHALVHRAGLRAEILTGGALHVGDEICEISSEELVARG